MQITKTRIFVRWSLKLTQKFERQSASDVYLGKRKPQRVYAHIVKHSLVQCFTT